MGKKCSMIYFGDAFCETERSGNTYFDVGITNPIQQNTRNYPKKSSLYFTLVHYDWNIQVSLQ